MIAGYKYEYKHHERKLTIDDFQPFGYETTYLEVLNAVGEENGNIGDNFFHPFYELRIPHENKKEMQTITENIPDEFLELEMVYLGSAKVKEKSTLLKEEQECAVHTDITKDYMYTYSYRLFSSKEEYDSLEKECGFYNEDFKISFKEGRMFVCSYGKKLQWMKYNPSWKAPSGGLVNRAGFEDMSIAEDYVFFYELDFEPYQYGYLADMITEEKNPPDEFIDLKLTYVGSAGFSGGPTICSGLMYEEDGMQFTNMGYWTILSRDAYETYVELCGINEDDLSLKIREGKSYIFSWGREIKCFQFNPAHKDRYGGLMNRAVLDWDMESKDELLFFYEYNYDRWIEGGLADMSIETFD